MANNNNEEKKSRVKSITVRFNREILPFQHVRLEAMATITKDDDADEVRKEVVSYLKEAFQDVADAIYQSKTFGKDNLPY